MLLSRNPEICAAELDGEVCLFHPDTAEYLNLNATASMIWNLLETPGDREALITQLLARYEVEAECCRRETEHFLTLALQRGLLLAQPIPD